MGVGREMDQSFKEGPPHHNFAKQLNYHRGSTWTWGVGRRSVRQDGTIAASVCMDQARDKTPLRARRRANEVEPKNFSCEPRGLVRGRGSQSRCYQWGRTCFFFVRFAYSGMLGWEKIAFNFFLHAYIGAIRCRHPPSY